MYFTIIQFRATFQYFQSKIQQKVLKRHYEPMLSTQSNQLRKYQPEERKKQNKNLLQSGTQSFKSSFSSLSNNSMISSLAKSNSNWRNQKSYVEFKNRLDEAYIDVCETLLIFLQKSNFEIIQQQKIFIQVYALQLIKILDQFGHTDEIDIVSFGIFDQLISLLSQLFNRQYQNQEEHQEVNIQQLKDRLNKKVLGNKLISQDRQTNESKTKIIQNVSKIVYIMFTGENKQIHTKTILGLQEDHQRIFMDLISRQMTQTKVIKNLNKNTKKMTRHRTSQSFHINSKENNQISFLPKNAAKKVVINSFVHQKSQHEVEYQPGMSKSYSRGSFFNRTSNNFCNSLSNCKSNQNLRQDLKCLQISKISKCDSLLRFSLSNQQVSKEDQETKEKSSIVNVSNNKTYQCINCHKKTKTEQERPQLLTQLINKILNLQQQNEKLIQQVEILNKKCIQSQAQSKQSQKINKKYEKDNKELNYKISELINKIGHIQNQSIQQKLKIQKKLQKKLQIIQFHKQQQYKQLSEINQNLHKNYQGKIQQFQYKLQKKEQKIVTLNERISELQQQLKLNKQKNNALSQEIKHLNEKIIKNFQQINQLQLAADSFCIQIEVRNSRIEDLKMLLLSEAKTINKNSYSNIKPKNAQNGKNTKFTSEIGDLKSDMSSQFQDNIYEKQTFGKGHPSWTLQTNQWKKSSQSQSFNRLSLNPDTKYSGSGNSWFKHSFKIPNMKKYQQQNHQYDNLKSYICYLKHKINLITKENQQYIHKIKSLRDIKYQNAKLLRSLNQHQNYRGQENQIILGCLFQVTQLIQEDKVGKKQLLDISVESKFIQRLTKIKQKRKTQKSMYSQKNQRRNVNKSDDLKQILSLNGQKYKQKYILQQNQCQGHLKQKNQIQKRQIITQKCKQFRKQRIIRNVPSNNILQTSNLAFGFTL